MSNPKVSVIIPNYNHARYLDQRIQSVLNQTYQDFEVIILDDCSTDNSLEVINKYKDNPHVSQIIVNEVNSGSTFKQWDKGIHLAKGEIIWIAESDDYCKLDMLEELVNAFVKKPNIVLAYSTSTMVDEDGNILENPKWFYNQYFRSRYFLCHYLSGWNVVANASSAIFSKKAALEANELFKTLKGAGDYLFWVEISSKGGVAIVNKGMNYFRRHSDVVTYKRDRDGTNYREEKIVVNEIKKKTRFSRLRESIICSIRIERLKSLKFESDSVKRELWTMWKGDRFSSPFYRFIVRIRERLIMKYHYYL